MKNQTVLQEIKEQMQEMKAKKAAELEAIHQKQTEAQTQKEAAELAVKDATEKMDLDAYEEAKAAENKAASALAMYSGRYKQIKTQEYISEEESDKVIDRLLEYEKTLDAEYRAALAEQIKALEHLTAEYKKEINETENTIAIWGQDIRANYSTRGQSIFTDPETGITTDRSKTPVAVHVVKYLGCSEANITETYLKNIKG